MFEPILNTPPVQNVHIQVKGQKWLEKLKFVILSIVQSRLSSYYLISAFKNFRTKGLRFLPCTQTSQEWELFAL